MELHSQAAKSTFRADPDYLIDTWETEDGLPENSATAMAQTPDGYLWFGTFNGLVRFDGVRFTVFDPSNTPELPGYSVVNLHQDRRGRFWISTDAGLVMSESEPTGDAARWHRFTAQDGWVGDYVRTFAERANGDLLMTTFDGHVLVFDERFTELRSIPGEAGQGYLGGVDERGQWWLTQSHFVGRYDGERWVSMLPSSLSVGRSTVASAPAKDGGLWILQGKDLMRIRDGREISRLSLTKIRGGMWSMMQDSRTNIWICSYDSGLFRVAPDGSVRSWTKADGLGSHAVRFVFEDREGNLWVGTNGGGLKRFKSRRVFEMGPGEPLSERIIKSLWPASDGGVWVASYELGLFHCTSNEARRVVVSGPNADSRYGLCVLEDRSRRLWYGDLESGWWRRDQLPFESIPFVPPSGAQVRALFQDSNGWVWIADRQGVVVYDGTTFRRLESKEGVPSGGVTCFAEDSAAKVWLAGPQGVFRRDGERFVEVRTPHGQAFLEVQCLKAEPDGTMWMGTRASGLLRWRSGQLKALATTAGLPARGVNAILEDDLGQFWMPSGLGILRVAKKELHAVADGGVARLNCQLLNREDGLPSAECATGQPTCARNPAGRLWFATQKGVVTINPSEFHLNALPPPVRIEQLSYHRSETAKSGLSDSAENVDVVLKAPFPRPPRLPPGSRRINIEYTALCFSAPEKVRFQIKLEGISHNWEDVQARRVARFYELRPGQYVFRVRGANSDGIWNEAGTSLAFAVQPFFWQTVWFRAAVAVLLLGFGGTLTWWRAQVRHRSQLDRLESASRLQAELAHVSRLSLMGELSASMAHELNQPLTAILANAQAAQRFLAAGKLEPGEIRDILKDVVQDTTRARDVIRHLRKLLRKDDQEFARLDLNEVIRQVVAFLHSDIVARNVNVELNLAPTLPPVLGDRVQLQQVLLNLLLNAFDAMSGNPPRERVATVCSRLEAPHAVRVTVSDRGVGINPEAMEKLFQAFYTTKPEGLGMGLSVTRSIIEAHRGRIWAENNAGRGASLHFTLNPAGQSRLRA